MRTSAAAEAAAVRRQPAAARATAAAAKTKANATATNPVAAFFFNGTPSQNWASSPTQGPNGVMTGVLNVTDPEEDPLEYSITTGPLNGTVAVRSDGSYTYVPSEAFAYDGTFDSFTITASDAGAGFHLHGLAGLLNLLTFGLLGLGGHTTSVTVPVNVSAWKKHNTDPTATYSVGAPDPTTGAVIGQINAIDAEGDPLTYTATSAPAKGSVTFTAAGGFTYTPTPDARHAAARDWVTESDLSDTFTVTISDGRGGSVSGPIEVPIGPKNDAPVAAAPTVGTPGASGVITGNVTATDADNDTLTYSGPGTTSKGTVTIDPRTGAFTYTPNASAHGMAASTDTFTITITDGYGGSTPVAVSVPIAALAVGNSMIHYSFNYTTGSYYWTPEAMNALQFAADKIASYFVVSQPVNLTFNVTAYNSPDSRTLASAGSDMMGFGPGYFYTVVQNKFIRGTDSNFSAADGTINVNFGNSWSFGDDVQYGQYDFVSVMMHEMMHAYGFLTNLDQAGYNNGAQWPLFTSGITDWTGTKIINGSYRFDTTFNPNLTGGNRGLYFYGAHAVDAYGGLVPLYTPPVWESGSSGSHLDDYTFWATQLMEATTGSGPGVRVLSPIEQGILQDLGYTITTPSWSSMMLVGFGFFIRRRRKQ